MARPKIDWGSYDVRRALRNAGIPLDKITVNLGEAVISIDNSGVRAYNRAVKFANEIALDADSAHVTIYNDRVQVVWANEPNVIDQRTDPHLLRLAQATDELIQDFKRRNVLIVEALDAGLDSRAVAKAARLSHQGIDGVLEQYTAPNPPKNTYQALAAVA